MFPGSFLSNVGFCVITTVLWRREVILPALVLELALNSGCFSQMKPF